MICKGESEVEQHVVFVVIHENLKSATKISKFHESVEKMWF